MKILYFIFPWKLNCEVISRKIHIEIFLNYCLKSRSAFSWKNPHYVDKAWKLQSALAKFSWNQSHSVIDCTVCYFDEIFFYFHTVSFIFWNILISLIPRNLFSQKNVTSIFFIESISRKNCKYLAFYLYRSCSTGYIMATFYKRSKHMMCNVYAL